jgi:hypothetical protein
MNHVTKETGRSVLPQHETLLVEAGKTDRREIIAQLVRMAEEDRRLAYRSAQPAVAVSASRTIAELLGVLKNPAAITAEVTLMDTPTIEGNRDLARRIAMTLAMAEAGTV